MKWLVAVVVVAAAAAAWWWHRAVDPAPRVATAEPGSGRVMPPPPPTKVVHIGNAATRAHIAEAIATAIADRKAAGS